MRLRHFLPPHHVVECPLCGAHVKVVHIKKLFNIFFSTVACISSFEATQEEWWHQKSAQVWKLKYACSDWPTPSSSGVKDVIDTSWPDQLYRPTSLIMRSTSAKSAIRLSQPTSLLRLTSTMFTRKCSIWERNSSRGETSGMLEALQMLPPSQLLTTKMLRWLTTTKRL